MKYAARNYGHPACQGGQYHLLMTIRIWTLIKASHLYTSTCQLIYETAQKTVSNYRLRLLLCVENIMTLPSGRQVLQLYRDLLRYGRQLQFTDKDYFARRIRKEFKQAKNIENAEDIKFYYQRGLAILKNKRIV